MKQKRQWLQQQLW